MARRGPPTSGYERLAQEDDLTDSDEDESSLLVAGHTVPIHAPPLMSPGPRRNGARINRPRSHSAVDIKVINARLEKWADQIANKFKFKRDRSQQGSPPLEILHSVFVPPEGTRPAATDGDQAESAQSPEETQDEFDAAVESVRVAISKGIDPKLIKQGSSGSYFMRDSSGRVEAVFKPKDEEPYAQN